MTRLEPNVPSTLGFTLLRHGVTPVDWGSAQIVLTNDQTGQEIIATATPSGPIGHWSADVTLPAEGSWSYQVRHDLEITLMRAQPISVGSSQAAIYRRHGSDRDLAGAAVAAGSFLALLGMALLAGALLVVRRSPPDEVRA